MWMWIGEMNLKAIYKCCIFVETHKLPSLVNSLLGFIVANVYL